MSNDADKTRWRGKLAETLCKICQECHPRLGINKDAALQVEDLVLSVFQGITACEPHSIADVEQHVLRSFPDPVCRWAIAEAQDVLMQAQHIGTARFIKTRGQTDMKAHISPAVVQAMLREKLGYKLDPQVAIYAAAVLDYVATDILKLSGNYVKNIPGYNWEISCCDLNVSLRADPVLMELLYPDEDDTDSRSLSSLQQGNLSTTSSLASTAISDDSRNAILASKTSYDSVVKNLVHHENQHLRNLNMILHVFRRKFVEHYPDTSDVDVLFSNILDLHEVTLKFLGSLEDTEETTRESGKPLIGGCFLEMAEGDEFSVYERYAKDITDSDNLVALEKILADKAFCEVLEGTDRCFLLAAKYVLPELLLQPIFHCFRYFDILEDLLNLTTDDEDRDDLEQTESLLVLLKSALAALLPVIAKRRSLQPPPSHRAHTDRFARELCRQIDSVDNASELLVEGQLTRISYSTSRLTLGTAVETLRKTVSGAHYRRHARHRMGFLVESKQSRNAALLLCKLSSGSNTSTTGTLRGVRESLDGRVEPPKVKEHISLRRTEILDVEDDEDWQNAFEIQQRDRDQRILMVASNGAEKRQWMAALVLCHAKPLLDRMLDGCLAKEKKLHPLILPTPDEYAFAAPDTEECIMFEDYTSSSGMPVVKGATLMKLVERLTYHTYVDHKFLRTMLTTYRTFCSPSSLLRLLIDRFAIPEPGCLLSDGSVDEVAARESLKRFRKEYVQPVQFRVLNVVRHWVENHWYDFETDPVLLEQLRSFVENIKTSTMQRWVQSILKIIERKLHNNDEVPSFTFTVDPPPIEWHIATPDGTAPLDLMTLHPLEIARQITLLEFDLYRNVKPIELVGAAWTKKDKDERSPQLLKLTRHSTKLVYWFEKCIIDAANVEERVAVMNRILEIMIAFQELNNFNGLIEIFSVLHSSAVHRLQHSWERIDPKLLRNYDKLRPLAEDGHHRRYNDLLRSINPPCVPFFGTYLSNIVFLEVGNPVFLRAPRTADDGHSGDESTANDVSGVSQSEQQTAAALISFAKCRKIADIIGEIQMYQKQPYCLHVERSMRDFFESLDPLQNMTDQEFQTHLWNRSEQIEPRDCDKLPYFAQSREYSLKSPGLKPRAGHKMSKDVSGAKDKERHLSLTGTGTLNRSSQPPPPLSATHHGDGDQDTNVMGIVDIKPGGEPKYMGDVPLRVAAASATTNGETAPLSPLVSSTTSSPINRAAPPLPYRPPRLKPVVSNVGANELSPPLPPRATNGNTSAKSSRSPSSLQPAMPLSASHLDSATSSCGCVFDFKTLPSQSGVSQSVSPLSPNESPLSPPVSGAHHPHYQHHSPLSRPGPAFPSRQSTPPVVPPRRSLLQSRAGSSPPTNVSETLTAAVTPTMATITAPLHARHPGEVDGPPLPPRLQKPPPRPPKSAGATPPQASSPSHAPPLPPRTYRLSSATQH